MQGVAHPPSGKWHVVGTMTLKRLRSVLCDSMRAYSASGPVVEECVCGVCVVVVVGWAGARVLAGTVRWTWAT